MTPTDTGPWAHALHLVRSTVPRLHPAGRPIVAGIAATPVTARSALRALGLRRTARAVTRLGIAATAGSALFFRWPERVPPMGADHVIAPADGLVSLITRAVPPPETGLGGAARTRISIFLSVLDVHVQWLPISGSVTGVHYHPGAFLSADLDKASEVNERNSVVIAPTGGGQPLVVTQIAGLVARRIVCDIAAGEVAVAGATYGLIRFGSRLDTYLPEGAEPQVRVGQRAVGGETVLARLGSAGPRGTS